MTPQETVEMANQIRTLSKAGRFDEAYQKYKNVNHPELFYVLGVQAYNLDFEDIAKNCFIEGAKFCTEGEHKYYNTIFANSIGQCITLLLTNNLIRTQDKNVLARLFIFGHLYLSNSIKTYGTKAYESHNSRYKLVNETNHTDLFASILKQFGVLIEAIPLMNASDLQQSSIGYANTPYFMNAEELLNKAYKIITIYKSLHLEYDLTPAEFFDTGKMMNDEYFKKMNASTIIFSPSFKIEQDIY